VLHEIKFVKKVYESDANFILIAVDNATARYKELLTKGVVVRNRSGLPLCQNTLRLTVGTREENIKLIRVLKELEQ